MSEPEREPQATARAEYSMMQWPRARWLFGDGATDNCPAVRGLIITSGVCTLVQYAAPSAWTLLYRCTAAMCHCCSVPVKRHYKVRLIISHASLVPQQGKPSKQAIHLLGLAVFLLGPPVSLLPFATASHPTGLPDPGLVATAAAAAVA